MDYQPIGMSAPPRAAARVRVALAPPAGGEPASVWATADGTTLTLAHDYPDLAPAAGWTATGRGLSLTVAAVDGRVLTCTPTPGGADGLDD